MLPVLWCVFHVVKSTGSVLAGRAVDAMGPRPMIFAGWLVYAAVYLAFALASAAWHIWALFLVYGVFFALTEPAERTLAAALAGSEQKGLAFGWFNFAIGVAALPSSLLFGAIYQAFGPLAAFGWGAALATAAAALLARIKTS
jgi:MFS family permease